ncbi:hypothetical protein F511_06438 [Dorcoceras hygrometricum]|uniref:Glycerol-3-phosphate dehydrogenase NAD-dependent N-terminal domain-containing protein n=1 Tax=Dorcoceras hygrometricum TaxID=472368 RepID=A0A2Z7AZF6_9LAMI|nr:hypothetical protein F511_06438 [Dorcoceras hygrometricum]
MEGYQRHSLRGALTSGPEVESFGGINHNSPELGVKRRRCCPESLLLEVGIGGASFVDHSNKRDEVRMWVFEEVLPTGEKLSEVINKTNENIKYLQGIKLGKNVVADPDLENAVRDANVLVFVTPHQFMEGICRRLVGKIRDDAEAISLIKGMEVKKEGPCMISALISEQLGVKESGVLRNHHFNFIQFI